MIAPAHITTDAVKIKPYSMQELAGLYHVCRKTLYKWLEPHNPVIGKRIGRFFTARQVKIIFEKLGEP
jgi:hypothetical protein